MRIPPRNAIITLVACTFAFGGIWFGPLTYLCGDAARILRARALRAAIRSDPFHNHHQVVSDQYFAYDFVRDGGESWDQPILAPCDG